MRKFLTGNINNVNDDIFTQQNIYKAFRFIL